MSKRFLSLCSLIAVVGMMLVILPIGTAIEAAPGTPGSNQGLTSTSSSSPQDSVAGVKRDPRIREATETEADPSSPAMYIVRLQGEPLASYTGGVSNLAPTSPLVTGAPKLEVNSAASQSYRSYLSQQRQQVTNQVSAVLGSSVKVAYTYDVAFNGMALMLTPAQAAKVSRIPGVVKVQPAVTQYADTDAGPLWIGANTVWNGSPGQFNGTRGEGILVGMIDTGINFSHPSFAATGGDGYTHVNPFGAGNYIGVCNPADPMYQPGKVCNAKLVGARTYPDTLVGASPEDDEGHGSHTASTVAGNVITSTLLNGVSTGQISGVAPHANIIAYDGCNAGAGCPGAALLAAINDAVADGVDVINYSIGGPSRDPWQDDTALAFLNARDAGVFVAVSAGNSGPGASTIGSPSNSPWVTSVGASTHNRLFINSVTNLNSSGGTLPDIVGKSLSGAYSVHPIVYAGAAPYNNPLCAAFPAGTFSGQIVVCDRGTIGRVAKGQNVLAAGGGGMILANDIASGNSLIADAHVLPAVHITYSAGVALKAWLASGTNHMGAISGTTKDLSASNGDIMASFSSRGPDATSPGVIKPDVAAPGVDVLAAGANNPGTPEPEYQILSGTSMASPHTAGAGTLIRVIHPDWTPAQIQSALMTTAVRTGVRKEDGTTAADPFDRGGGRIDVSQAVRAGLVLDETKAHYLAADPAAGGDARTLNVASMADMQCIAICSWTRTLSSTLGASATWTASVASTSGVTVTVTPSSFTIPAHGQQTITVTADVAGLPKDVPLFASVTLTEGGSQAPAATFPIAIMSVNSIVPDLVDISTRRNLGSQQSGDITSSGVTDLTVREYGLTRATLDMTALPGDPTNGDVYDDLTIAGGVYTKTVTVPPGTKRLVAEITASAANDTDLYVHHDGAGGPLNGIPSAGERVCTSSSSSALEYCDIEDPAAGTYIILVDSFDPSNNPPDAITLATAVVPATDAGNMTVTGPASVPAGTPFNVDVGWNLPTAQAGDRWYGAFDLGSDSDHPGDIGSIPVNLVRLADELSVTKSVTPTTAGPGTTLTYTLVITNQDTITHTFTLTDALPAGVTYVPGSVTGGATYNAAQNSINLTAVADLVPADNYVYEDSLTVPDLAEQSPLGGFIDFSAAPYNFTPAPRANNSAFNMDTTCPVSFYDSAEGTDTFLGYSTNGLFFPRGAGVGSGSPITTTLPSASTPNGLIAGFWNDMSLQNNNGFTNAGRLLVNFGPVPCDQQVSIIQLHNLHTKTDSSPTRNALDVEVVYDHNNQDNYWVLYGNVRGPLNGGVLGLENYDGTLGLQYLYANTPSEHMPADDLVIHYYRPLIPAPITITFQATVDSTATYEVTNVANYSVEGDPYVKSASATFINPAAIPAHIVASAGTPQSALVNTAFATALQATVTNAVGAPVNGATVTFTAPASGASGTFAGGGRTATATTNASGIATAPTFTANGTFGSYVVSASVSGVGTPASFNLTNTAPPMIITQPASQTIMAGHTATLSVVATGTTPLSYQWYQGNSGDTSRPIGGATSSSYTTPALSSTQSYWVRVSNSAGSANSTTATITVNQYKTFMPVLIK